MQFPDSPQNDSEYRKWLDTMSEEQRQAYEKGKRAGEITGHIFSQKVALKESIAEKFAAEMKSHEAEWKAAHDDLTGLLNKARLKELVAERIKSVKPSEKFGLFFADLTNFKKANDVLGHERVDRLLAEFGPQLEQALRTEEKQGFSGRPDGPDYVAHERVPIKDTLTSRYGGDEFAGLVDLTEQDGKLTPEERLGVVNQRVRDTFLEFIGTQEPEVQQLKLDLAIGGQVWQEGMTSEQLFEAADKNMGRHKAEQHQVYGSYRPTS